MLTPQFPEVHLPFLDHVPLPPMRRVRLPQPKGTPIADLEAAVETALGASRRLAELASGASVAVAVGSRGIARIDQVAKAAVAHLKGRGLAPFIVPAMGTHGGGTAEGQAQVLAHLGITEATVGAPVRATMEVVDYGATPAGPRCKFDRNAAEADAVLLINRVKSHTSFDRPVESGLTKLIAVGLGKAEGARNVHVLGPRGYTEVLPELARMAIAHAPIAYGLALVENADKQLVTLEGVEPEAIYETDQRLLQQAKTLIAKLPFAQLDGLIVEWIGKEISGAGMDCAVTGRIDIRGVAAPKRPLIHKIAVLGVTPESEGNGIGLGLADYTTRAVVHGLDLAKMYLNGVVSTTIEAARMPVVLADDRTALQALVASCWQDDPMAARVCQICSTLHLEEVLVSPALYQELDGQAGVAALGEAAPLAFDGAGQLATRCGPLGS